MAHAECPEKLLQTVIKDNSTGDLTYKHHQLNNPYFYAEDIITAMEMMSDEGVEAFQIVDLEFPIAAKENEEITGINKDTCKALIGLKKEGNNLIRLTSKKSIIVLGCGKYNKGTGLMKRSELFIKNVKVSTVKGTDYKDENNDPKLT